MSRVAVRKLRRWFLKGIENLGTDQVSVLIKYAESSRTSIHFSPSDGAVLDLVKRGVLYRPEQRMRPDGWLAYCLTPEAVEFVRGRKFQELLNTNSVNSGFPPPYPERNK
jgi:hypothetical protein